MGTYALTPAVIINGKLIDDSYSTSLGYAPLAAGTTVGIVPSLEAGLSAPGARQASEEREDCEDKSYEAEEEREDGFSPTCMKVAGIPFVDAKPK